MTLYEYNTNETIDPVKLHDELKALFGDAFNGVGWTDWQDKPKELIINTNRDLTAAEKAQLETTIEKHTP